MSAPEAAVVRSLKKHLLAEGLHGTPASRVLVDADPSYAHSRYARDLEPMARVSIGAARPDMLCALERAAGQVVAGFEVKAKEGDWARGLGQARSYRAGVHHAYLALPARPDNLRRAAGTMAKDVGVGLLALDGERWVEVTPPADPLPLPQDLSVVSSALRGVPTARRLQLNHPLNYLVIPYLASFRPGDRELIELLEAEWPDLGTAGTRRHAIEGAISLGLVDRRLAATLEGRTVADLLDALGFTPQTRPSKRARLCEAAPALAAVARFVLLQQPVVRLILQALETLGGGATLPDLDSPARVWIRR